MVNSINAYKHMENFEEVMEQFCIKTQDKYGTVYYEPKVASRTKTIDVRSGARVNASNLKPPKSRTASQYLVNEVMTPMGVFGSVLLAAEAYNISKAAMYSRIKNDKENFYYGKKSCISYDSAEIRGSESDTTQVCETVREESL